MHPSIIEYPDETTKILAVPYILRILKLLDRERQVIPEPPAIVTEAVSALKIIIFEPIANDVGTVIVIGDVL